MLVTRGRYGSPQQIGMIVNGFHHIHQERQKAEVLFWFRSWCKQVNACIRRKRPVVVLSAPVNTGEWLFVEKDLKVMLVPDFLH
ncbi:hypothetical protein D3C87_1946550 [compost metagenome]